MTTHTRPGIASHVTCINIHSALTHLLSQVGSRLGGSASHSHGTIAAPFRADLIIHLDRGLLEVSGALLEMIAVLRSVNGSVAALSLRVQGRPRYLLAHPHLLRV